MYSEGWIQAAWSNQVAQWVDPQQVTENQLGRIRRCSAASKGVWTEEEFAWHNCMFVQSLYAMRLTAASSSVNRKVFLQKFSCCLNIFEINFITTQCIDIVF